MRAHLQQFVAFQPVPESKAAKHRIQLDITVDDIAVDDIEVVCLA